MQRPWFNCLWGCFLFSQESIKCSIPKVYYICSVSSQSQLRVIFFLCFQSSLTCIWFCFRLLIAVVWISFLFCLPYSLISSHLLSTFLFWGFCTIYFMRILPFFHIFFRAPSHFSLIPFLSLVFVYSVVKLQSVQHFCVHVRLCFLHFLGWDSFLFPFSSPSRPFLFGYFRKHLVSIETWPCSSDFTFALYVHLRRSFVRSPVLLFLPCVCCLLSFFFQMLFGKSLSKLAISSFLLAKAVPERLAHTTDPNGFAFDCSLLSVRLNFCKEDSRLIGTECRKSGLWVNNFKTLFCLTQKMIFGFKGFAVFLFLTRFYISVFFVILLPR